MAKPESFGSQFTSIVDDVLDRYIDPNVRNHMVGGGEFEAATIGPATFSRGELSITDDYEHNMPKCWLVTLPLGKLAVVKSRPDQIIRSHEYYPRAKMLCLSQMTLITTRELSDQESEDVIGLLAGRSTYTGPSLRAIFETLSQEEQASIDRCQISTNESDKRLEKLSRPRSRTWRSAVRYR